MPNQSNYVEVIPTQAKAFSVSRIAESPNDTEVIIGRQPGEFGFNANDNIEMHFYDNSDRLVGSVVVPVSSGIISSRTIITPDNPKEEKIVIDMTRVQKELGLLIPPGTYSVTLNFFSNEIGSFTDRKLTIQEVSPSRTELRLGFDQFSTTEQNELFEFTQPSVPRVVAEGLVETATGISDSTQKQRFIDSMNEYLLTVNPTLFEDLIDLEPDAFDNLDLTIDFISGVIYEEFVSLLEVTKNTAEFDKLQANELEILIAEAVNRALLKTNINLYTQATVRYVWGNIWPTQQII